MSDELEKLNEVVTSRRDVLKTLGATTVAGALLSTAGFDPAMAQDLMASSSPLKCAMSNAGLQATWCAQGKEAAEAWGALLNAEVTWFDGELSATKQRATIDNMAAQQWDIVAIQTFGIGTLNDPVSKMIDAGTPVIAMDTMMAPEGQLALHTFIAPDNVFMGSITAQTLFDAIGGEGQVVMTQGALGHTGAQGRAQGFRQVLANYPNIELVDEQPADWDVTKVARIWDSLLTKFPDLKGGFFHNDDMALAANNVIKSNASFGFVMLPPLWDGQEDFFVDEWDDPYAFTWFAGGWGSDSNRYVANAVRKIRPLLRINDEVSTLSMVLGSGPTEFEDVVEQVNDNGDFEWGDFPYGGASVVRYGPLELVGACSGFKQVEDHLVTELILGHLAKRILAESDPPLP